jgi:AcrR family transcriptional regulator
MTGQPLDDTATEIRRIALRMFAEQGYDGTSIRDIAEAVGIRAASLYHHFGSKEQILWSLTKQALEDLAASWRAAQSSLGVAGPLDRLRAFVRADVTFHAENRTAATVVNSQLRRLEADHYAQAVGRRRAYETELTRIVEDCVATGDSTVPDVRVTVFAILQMTIAIAEWFDPAGPLSPSRLAEIYEELAVKMLAKVPVTAPAGCTRGR